MASLYIHIPFCERKCVYCDFYSVESRSHLDEFLSALRGEIAMTSPGWGSHEFDTVYFGGGTPSLLEPDELGSLLALLRSSFRISPGAEVTVETNPGTVDRAKLAAYRSLGVNRLSIGLQSFHDDELRFLGRIHDVAASVRCVEDARGAGFANVSIDLIYSLPGQTRERWEESLRRAVELGPEHISAYSLIVEDGTPLARMVRSGLVTPTPPEAEADLYALTMEYLEARGFDHYEVSNYARHGLRSRHNSAYWIHTDYLGLGPSAHSFLNGGRSGRRWANVSSISSYADRIRRGESPQAFEELVSTTEFINERIFLGLRGRGIQLNDLRERFDVDLRAIRKPVIDGLLDERYAQLEGDALRLTSKGFLLCDEIAGRLML